MKKYNSKKANQIVELFRSDTYTVFEICRMAKISKSTLYRWMSEYPDFAQAIEDAKEEMAQILFVAAKKSLRKKIEGYEVTETRTVTIPGGKDADGKPKPKIKEQITTKKYIQPDTAAIIFTLTNGDPEHWRNRQTTELVGRNGNDLFAEKTDEQLMEMINELNRKLS